jgi:carbamoyl-phosphate synthase small subunit
VGYRVVRVPWNINPLGLGVKLDGVVCSNGPGDPKECGITIANIRKILVADVPFLGICLGHQLLALAIDADTYKLKYGHRGLNQPCQDTISKKAYVTSQNHGYGVKANTLPKDYREWFVNLNDGTNEGIIHKNGRIKSVQFHPEGSPGPFDAKWIFSHFKDLSS